MTNKLSNLLKKVFLSSLAGIAANHQSFAIENNTTLAHDDDASVIEAELNRKPDLSAKLLLKKATNDEWEFTSHRSHRSHSSHRSHYSSYSGGGSSYTPSRSSSGYSGSSSSSSGSSGSSSGSGVSSRSSIYSAPRPANVMRLGSRILRKGMKGTDVTELINILLKKGYLTLELGQTQVSGSYTFDVVVETAVKEFQSDNKLTNDGICGSMTIYYLKNR